MSHIDCCSVEIIKLYNYFFKASIMIVLTDNTRKYHFKHPAEKMLSIYVQIYLENQIQINS